MISRLDALYFIDIRTPLCIRTSDDFKYFDRYKSETNKY